LTLTLHRISKLQYATVARLEDHGIGAARYGGRWNSADPSLKWDRRIIYTSDTLAQATLEVIVHVESRVLHTVPHGHVTFRVDPEAVIELAAGQLSVKWNVHPVSPASQVIGDEWYDLNVSPVLRVPSAILPLTVYGPGQANYLINTRHPEINRAVQQVCAVPLSFDPRLPAQ